MMLWKKYIESCVHAEDEKAHKILSLGALTQVYTSTSASSRFVFLG